MRYAESKIKVKKLYSFFKECDDIFYPRIKNNEEIKIYSQKLYEHAIIFCSYNEKELVGIVAAYFSQELKTAYITSVCVNAKYRKQNIAYNLMIMCIDKSIELNLKKIQLEVYRDNLPAISLYKKFGFTIKEEDEYFTMEKII
jgi:ribosomal protein S18 acetylase RimI-like enzyme